MAVESAVFLHVMISLGILLFAAKLMAELFHKVKLPIVLGELLAGIIVGPFALGALPLINGEPLVVLDETVRHVGEIVCRRHFIYCWPRDYPKGVSQRRSSSHLLSVHWA